MAIHSSILAWKSPWTGKPGGFQSMGLQRVRCNWAHISSSTSSGSHIWLTPVNILYFVSTCTLSDHTGQQRTDNVLGPTPTLEDAILSSIIDSLHQAPQRRKLSFPELQAHGGSHHCCSHTLMCTHQSLSPGWQVLTHCPSPGGRWCGASRPSSGHGWGAPPTPAAVDPGFHSWYATVGGRDHLHFSRKHANAEIQWSDSETRGNHRGAESKSRLPSMCQALWRQTFH